MLNYGRGNIGGAPKTSDGLENLQLHQQYHLRRGCSRNRRRPLALIEAWTEELLQVAWGPDQAALDRLRARQWGSYGGQSDRTVDLSKANQPRFQAIDSDKKPMWVVFANLTGGPSTRRHKALLSELRAKFSLDIASQIVGVTPQIPFQETSHATDDSFSIAFGSRHPYDWRFRII